MEAGVGYLALYRSAYVPEGHGIVSNGCLTVEGVYDIGYDIVVNVDQV